MSNFTKYAVLAMSMLCAMGAFAQHTTISGKVVDEHTKEPVSFASVYFLKGGMGKYTDSAGNFEFNLSTKINDTLIVTSVGYEPEKVPMIGIEGRVELVVAMQHAKKTYEVIIKTKISRGLFLWKKIMSKKDIYNRYSFTNFGYEAYNKLEIDIRNFNAEKLKKNFLLKPYSFIFDNVDSTSEERPFLPAYLIESLSDYAFQKDPKKFKEHIKAKLTRGIENESITKMLGVMNQNVNIYSNFIYVMDKNFISPFNDNADAYYRFSVADTQVIGSKRVYHFVFKPKRPGQNTFEGDAWVTAGDFRIKKISMFLGRDANINYIERVSVFQEYQPLNDSIDFIVRDKFFADFNLIGKKSLSFIGRKSTSYKNIVVNADSIAGLFKNQNQQEVVTVADGVNDTKEKEWEGLRHDTLNKNEKAIYATIDKLESMPQFQKLQTNLQFLGTGYRNIGKVEIGPWFNWVSSNSLEGLRLRWDMGTNYRLDKNVYLHGYLAYGTKDNKYKGKAEAYWVTARRRWTRIHAAYSNDIDNGISRLGEVSQDNIFTLAIRKPNAYQRFLQIQDTRFETYAEWGKGFSTEVFLVHRKFSALKNLPELNPEKIGKPLQNMEVALKLRFAYLEQFVTNDYFRYSVGTNFPVGELIVAKGIKGFAGSQYDYTHASASIRDNIKIAPYGDMSIKLYGGKVFGTVPYPLLEIHPGNNLYYYTPGAFNLMTRFEYISDQYAGLNVEHHIGSGIFRFFKPTRKMKWRQFWNAKVLVGSLSEQNAVLNNANFDFKTLNGTHYAEIGTGIDNILRVLRLDLVWRISPNPTVKVPTSSFAVFGSFQFQF